MKPSLTKCTVLWRGFVVAGKEQRVPVAKVLLSPWTGRRHQLRVHLSRVAGCPILGDVAYKWIGR
jgi:23S rRNA-/tRNA-specific pseudouridylate synthase